MEKKNEVEKLLSEIQLKLKAPKGQWNGFGKYKYRSCEDILEAVKPLLKGAILTISDEMVEVGGKVYVKATTILKVIDGGQVQTTAYARESETRKGMDDSQITGATSSYARKYALNGLLLIDDNKDADTQDNTKTKTETKTDTQSQPAYKKPEIVQTNTQEPNKSLISEPQRKRLYAIGKNAGWKDEEMKELVATFGYEHSKDIKRDDYNKICEMLEKGTTNIPHGDNKQKDLLKDIKDNSDENVKDYELDSLDKKVLEYKKQLHELTNDDITYGKILDKFEVSQPYELKDKEQKAELVTALANAAIELQKGGK